MLITLLNFLIAIISDSYADVMSKALIHQYRSKCDFNDESQIVLNMFPGWFKDNQYQARIYVIRSSKDESNEDMDPMVVLTQNIKGTLQQEVLGLKKMITKNMEDLNTSLEKKTSALDVKLDKLLAA